VKLADLRRAAVKHSSRVRFSLPDGLECVVDEHGVARIPALQRATSVNIERELETVRQFSVEAGGEIRNLTRDQVERWAGGADQARQEDHDD
jgi:hypothetical protein